MAELIDIKDLEERVILAAVSLSDGDDTESSLDELEELVKTAGGTAVQILGEAFKAVPVAR